MLIMLINTQPPQSGEITMIMISYLLNQIHTGIWPWHPWFLKIDSVWNIGMHFVCVCARVRMQCNSRYKTFYVSRIHTNQIQLTLSSANSFSLWALLNLSTQSAVDSSSFCSPRVFTSL